MNRQIVTVTGGTGYIASWIVHDLLLVGHEVRITVRNKSKVEKYQHLLDIESSAPGTLVVYEADLLQEGSFDKSIDGADIVMHTASPFLLDDKNDPKKNLVDPAVIGTQNVLNSVNKSESVSRVVLTSSLAAIYGDNQDMVINNANALNEEMWNTTSSLSHNAYSYSKTEAEKAAWAMKKKQKRWELVTIHPGFVLGPSLTKRKDSTSIETLLRLLHGDLRIGAPDLEFVFSDVRDVSKAHLLAAFNEKAKGRYIVANENGGLIDVGNIITKHFGHAYKVPKKKIPKWIVYLLAPFIGFTKTYVNKNIGYPLACDHSKSIRELGMTYHSLEETVKDHVMQLKDDEMI